ncbi:conjugal transfer protein TraO [Enterobacter ludwigii]
MSDQQNTGARSIGLMLTLAVAGIVAVAGGGYAMWTWMAAPPPTPSRVDLGRVAGTTQNSAAEQQAYRELLRENNARGAQDALAANKSFIASIPLQQDVVKTTPVTPAPVVNRNPQDTGTPPSGGRTQEQEKAIAEARQKALASLLARMQPHPEVSELPAAQIIGGKESGWGNWRDSLPGSGVQLAASRRLQDAMNTPPPQEVVAPYWRGPGEIYTGVNSDNGTTPVLGRFTTGPYAGAVLKAPDGAKLSGDGVIIHFTSMAFGGQNYKVDAYALQDDTLVANIATDVDHHYIRRIVLPSIFGGASEAGQLYAQSNTQMLSNGFNTVTARPELPDPTAVAGVIVGGMAQRAGQVLTNDAARLPDRTVTVDNGQVVAIQFMRGVYSTDTESPQSTVSTNTVAPTSRNNPSLTAAELRADTDARIRAAEQKGDTRE